MDFSELLDSSIPPAIQQAIFRIVVDEYRLTHANLRRQFEAAEAEDLEPHFRRANIESRLAELAHDFPNQVVVKVGENSKGNHYRYLVFGNLVLTQSYVEEGRRVPREALFRNGFAGDPWQMLLSPEAEAKRIEALRKQDRFYAILTHTPSLLERSEPSHVSVTFVDDACQHVESINLAERIAVRVAQSTKVEVVKDRAVARLRTDATARDGIAG